MNSQILFNTNVANWAAGALIQSGAYRIQKTSDRNDWYVWKSGVIAPVYCNTRQLISNPTCRHVAMSGLHAAINTFEGVEGILGMATAGIGWAQTIAHLSNLPSGYIRSTPKAHGLTGLLEYYAATTAKRVVIIDDLVASGGSIKKAIDIAKDSGLEVIGILSIVNWGFEEMHKELQGIPVKCLVSYPSIIQLLDLPDDAKADLLNFYKAPWNHVWQSSTFGQHVAKVAA